VVLSSWLGPFEIYWDVKPSGVKQQGGGMIQTARNLKVQLLWFSLWVIVHFFYCVTQNRPPSYTVMLSEDMLQNWQQWS
jgi:hypothetical protein